MVKEPVSIVVPTLNESANIVPLFARIRNALQPAGVPYEIIVVDDHSTDGTRTIAREAGEGHNARVYTKRGMAGKAYSLLEGFARARYQLICMIDADLQYPPEAIATMHALLTDNRADVVVTERSDRQAGAVRKLSSKLFNLLFVRLLFGISYDTQSGLKLFRSRVLQGMQLKPSPWSFDLEFLVRALEGHRRVISLKIPFAARRGGVTKVKLVGTTMELARASLALRLRTSMQRLRSGNEANAVFRRQAMPFTAAVLTVGAGTFIALAGQAAAQTPAHPAAPFAAAMGETLVTGTVPRATHTLPRSPGMRPAYGAQMLPYATQVSTSTRSESVTLASAATPAATGGSPDFAYAAGHPSAHISPQPWQDAQRVISVAAAIGMLSVSVAVMSSVMHGWRQRRHV